MATIIILQSWHRVAWCGSMAGLALACGSSVSDSAQPGAQPSTGNSAASSGVVIDSSFAASASASTPISNSAATSDGSEPPATSATVDTLEAPGSDVTDSGNTTQGPSSGETLTPNAGCTIGDWPAVDPAVTGPFETVTETNVGPAVGEGADGEPVAFTVFRPSNLAESDRCHPVITWGNGTGANPNLYRVLLNHLASHGFIVVASDSPNVAQGDPPPMVAGVSWLIEENERPESPYFQHIDTTHVGATGHSQGGFATTRAGGDEHITTVAPLCGASAQRNLHGPALLLCGGADDVVDCEGIANALDSINQPAMLANYITADHANWITFRGTSLSPMEVATTAWMRVHLMGDTALRPWFYGPACKLCTDDAWEITQKMMDE